MRVVPTGPTTVTTEYQTFRNPEASQDAFDRAAEFFESIELEDYELMNNVQKSLNAGVYVHGPLHEKRESGVLHFKRLVKEQLKRHYELERREGWEVWAARRYQQLHGDVGAEEAFCKAICGLGGGDERDIEDLV